MKRKLLAIALVLSMTLSGCSFIGLDPQQLMNPPRPTGEKAEIHALLEAEGGENMSLEYPARGEYRSAIIMHNITGGSEADAIAFYQKGDEIGGTNIVLLSKRDGNWVKMGSFNNAATQVDKICFGDVDGDGKDEAVVGWGSNLSSTSLYVYGMKDGKMQETKLEQSYSEMTVMDFTGDGYSEIFTANVTVGDQDAFARLIRIRNDGIELLGEAPLDIGVTRYVSISAGLINATQKGVVLDGSKGTNQIVTEVLYWDQDDAKNNSEKINVSGTGKLVSPFFDKKTKMVTATQRSTSVVSMDINDDTIIEIPIVTLLPSYTTPSRDDTCYLTNWHRYDTQNNNLVRSMSMVLSYTYGYWFLVPDIWLGNVTTEMDAQTRTLTFLEWKASASGTTGGNKNALGEAGDALLRIRVFSADEWAFSGEESEYIKLLDFNNLVYAAQIPNKDNPLSLSEEDVRSGFKLFNTELTGG